MQDSVFHLRIVSREGMVFEEDVEAISSHNETGPFDVLPQHANFISIIQKNVQIVKSDNSMQTIEFTQALLKVYQNHVNIYLGIEWLMPSENASTKVS